ncbi:MAG: hypothetical protein IJS89_01400 [Bacteroidaceae bacterium]|nr:hypothetical protein [Bacteroidaceae bacterium]
MKKIFTLLALLAVYACGTLGAFAQVHSTQTGTNTLNAATIMQKADAGTLWVAIQNNTTSSHRYMNKSGYMVENFAQDGSTSWQVVPHDDGGYALKNIDGQYIGNAARPMTLTADLTAATRFEPEDANAGVANIASGYNSSMAVRWKVLPDKAVWINGNGAGAGTTVQFNNGVGNWTCLFTYEVTMKYSVTLNCFDEDNNLLEAPTFVYGDGEVVDITAIAPEIMGYSLKDGYQTSVTIEGEDVAVDLEYATAATNTVTFRIVDEGDHTLFTSEPVVVNTGSTITTLPEVYKRTLFYDYDTVDTVVTEDVTLDITATLKESAPFVPSASADAAVWYVLKLKNANYPTYVADGTPNVTLPTSNADDTTVQWAFVGNPYSGFQIVNHAAGTHLVLGSPVASTTNNGGNDYATLAEPGTQACEVWFVEGSTYLTNGFFIRNSENQYLNQRSVANLAYWTNGHDTGSTFTVEKVKTYAEKIQAEVGPYMTTAVGQYFGLSAEGVAALQSEYDRLTADCSKDDYEEFMLTFEDALYDYMVMPATGYYRVKNARAGEEGFTYGYLGMHSDGKLYGDIPAATAAADASTVVRLTNNGDGTFYLEMEGANVDAAAQSTHVGLIADRCMATISGVAPGVAQILTGNGAYGYLHAASGNSYKIVGWRVYSDSPASGWIFEDAEELELPLTAVGDTSYASVCLPFPVTLNAEKVADGTLNFCTMSVSGEQAVLNVQQDGVIPAGLPVVVLSTEGLATVTATIGGENATEYENVLQGTYLPADAPEGTYVMSEAEGVAGFYPLPDGTRLTANQAYLVDENAVPGFAFVINENPLTSLNAVTATTRAGVVYDLQGRRVAAPAKGVYIVNGKKMLY